MEWISNLENYTLHSAGAVLNKVIGWKQWHIIFARADMQSACEM